MDWLDALILGIVQGLAEYLPISSSGHLEICSKILGLNLSGADSLQFDLVLHVATVLSTIVVLWKRFMPLCSSFFTLKRDENTTYVWKIILSCVPVGIVGLCFKKQVESFFGVSEDGGNNLIVVGICLCITAALLTFAHLFREKDFRKGPSAGRDISWSDALVIGIGQAIAVLPGLSRSGTTIATGIILGDKRIQVAQFSFFMVIIPILGEAFLDFIKILKAAPGDEQIAVGLLPMAVGFVASFLVGCMACKWMIDLVSRGKLVWFALYCVAVGILCICW
ncbi:MAG: undecaprenyl-diphosphate phosphatase [Bacteroidales bacterium]|nr:undecaprenyl-diphosphate phosphatase [Bacteroidales bacterium]